MTPSSLLWTTYNTIGLNRDKKCRIFRLVDIDFRFTAVSILAGYAAVAILERVPSLRLRESPFWRPFFATDVGWYLVAVAVTVAPETPTDRVELTLAGRRSRDTG